jgi:hypothetical protein
LVTRGFPPSPVCPTVADLPEEGMAGLDDSDELEVLKMNCILKIIKGVV